MDAQYIPRQIGYITRRKERSQSQLQHAFSDATIEKLEEQIKELDLPQI